MNLELSGATANGSSEVPASVAASILSLIAAGTAQSRAALVEASRLSRATVAHRLGLLFDAGLIEEAAETRASGGRPARILRVNETFGVVLAADIGETHIRLAATDLSGAMLADHFGVFDVRSGPTEILTWIAAGFRALLERTGRPERDVLGIGLSLPAPVDHAAGRVVGPSVMAGWDDFDIQGWFAEGFTAPVVVENDVNLMTLYEVRRFWPDVAHLLFIKAGTGIGCGIVADGRIYRGAQGAAGDIGHIQFTGPGAPLCRCGKLGCVEARAGGWALARDLRASGLEAQDARDVLALVHQHEPEAIRLVRQAGRLLGEVTADVVSVLNPSAIVIGGTLAGTEEHLLSGIRELVYQRSLPLATRQLRIGLARSDADASLRGAAHLVIDTGLGADRIERTIERHARRPA